MRSKIIIPFLFILIITGCSKAFFYNRLDTLIRWYLDDYVELTDTQQMSFDKKLDMLLKWHREEELKVYIGFLDQVEEDLKKTIDMTIVNNWEDQIILAYKRLETKMLPLFYETGEELNQQQIDQLIKNLWERQTELEEKYLSRSDEEYTEISHEKLKKNLKRFLGPLNNEQDEIIKTTMISPKRFDKAWLEERRLWYTSLQELLKRESDWQQQFIKAYQTRIKTRTQNYNESLNYNLEKTKQATVKVLNSRTEQQNQYLIRELNNYKDEFNSIIAEKK